ncbi:SAM-dependent methyltransferase, partial [Enterococcus wangshanyuanii]
KLSEILKVIDCEPLYGNKRAKTHWIVFMKPTN